ncbi:MAG: hypothetical protein ACRCXZ_07365 [Patescibacteria group bacterium]
MINTRLMIKNNKLARVTNKVILAGIFSLITLLASVPAYAFDAKPLFEQTGNMIYSIIGLIGAFIITPVGVLALIINIVMMISDVMTGNTHRVVNKIAWMIGLVILVLVGIFLGQSARSVFSGN